MKNKKFLTESDRKAIISDKEKAILESFAKTFNKIKRIDENELGTSNSNNPNTIRPDYDKLMTINDNQLYYVLDTLDKEKDIIKIWKTQLREKGHRYVVIALKNSKNVKWTSEFPMEYRENEQPKQKGSDEILIDNIEELSDNDLEPISPSEYRDSGEEKVLIELLNIIKKVNPNVNIEHKKLSLKRDFGENMEKLYKSALREYSVFTGIKEYFKDNLAMFK